MASHGKEIQLHVSMGGGGLRTNMFKCIMIKTVKTLERFVGTLFTNRRNDQVEYVDS